MCQGCPLSELKMPHSGERGMAPHPAIYILRQENPLTRTPEPSSSPRTGLNSSILVKWAGHQSNEDQTSWEPANHLQNSPNLVQDFHSSYPHKPCQP
ncbi:uncharacterized protein VP01_6148g1 [Puccinia sorghi]|uniref:Chromo domain-containing protein n=1 Tax=Puccinia sorghi TaxID=27349 RepID=A0A0L6UJ04_9BASI|nr:uncharacterized protein VP01_6148g1 [Puccinia sorghi]